MVASFHPKNGTVTLVSIPRDLWVTTDSYQGKINSLFPHAMLTTGYTDQTLMQALDRSAHETIEKVEDIT
jgi:anionic cell wall polymer biosynthesis LytR-Cps2A-Psr (LCP) family protein